MTVLAGSLALAWTCTAFVFGLVIGVSIHMADELDDIWPTDLPHPEPWNLPETPAFSLCPDSFIPMPDGRLLEIWA